MNEVQETDCYGNVLKQYVYGSGVDELLVMDEPAATLTDASGTCAFAGHGSGLDLASLLACLNPSITSTRPPAAEGACGPCAYEATSSITGFVGGDGKASCNPCLAYGNDVQAIARCISCNGEAYSFTAVPFTLAGAVGDCNPCGPHASATGVIVDATHWILDAKASMDCLPCPVRMLLGLEVFATGTDPTNPALTHGDPSSVTDCKPANLGARRYVLQDEQMSVYGLTDNDGIVVEGYEYDPYGNVLVFTPGASGVVTFTTSDLMTGPGTASIEYTYTGRRYDAESHLLYYRSRYLDSEMGRFISRDTIGVWGDKENLGNALALVGNQVHSMGDPTGTVTACALYSTQDAQTQGCNPCYDCVRGEFVPPALPCMPRGAVEGPSNAGGCLDVGAVNNIIPTVLGCLAGMADVGGVKGMDMVIDALGEPAELCDKFLTCIAEPGKCAWDATKSLAAHQLQRVLDSIEPLGKCLAGQETAYASADETDYVYFSPGCSVFSRKDGDPYWDIHATQARTATSSFFVTGIPPGWVDRRTMEPSYNSPGQFMRRWF